MSISTCPACQSRDLYRYPASRGTGRRVFECRRCRLVGWDDRASLPPVDAVGLDEISAEQRAAWVSAKRTVAVGRAWRETLDRLEQLLLPDRSRRIYDVGAGDGGFLASARDAGFQPRGNDIMEAAIELAASTRAITLDYGELSAVTVEEQDAVTLWCVLAHVPDPDALLIECHRKLRAGGVLFLQTPHRTFADTAALLVLRATRGRVCRLVDRRIAQHHWLLHTRRSMTATLRRLGFDAVTVEPQARYSMSSESYLASLGVPARLRGWLGKAMDALLRSPLAPHIVLDVYARRPIEPSTEPSRTGSVAQAG